MAVVVLFALSGAPASAQSDADRLFREGVALREAGDLPAAIERLRRAHRIDPTPRTTYNLAAALADQGRYLEASRLLRSVVDAPTGDDLLVRDAAHALLEDLTPRIAPAATTVSTSAERGTSTPDLSVVRPAGDADAAPTAPPAAPPVPVLAIQPPAPAEAPAAADPTWIWVGVGAGAAVVIGAVIAGTAIALSVQAGAAPIDGDFPEVHVMGGGR